MSTFYRRAQRTFSDSVLVAPEHQQTGALPPPRRRQPCFLTPSDPPTGETANNREKGESDLLEKREGYLYHLRSLTADNQFA